MNRPPSSPLPVPAEHQLAARISMIIAAVLASCTPDECRQLTSDHEAASSAGHDALCAVESGGGLDATYRAAYLAPSTGYATRLAADSCAKLCGDASVVDCDVDIDLRFAKHHPEVVPPACAYQNPLLTKCTAGSADAGAVDVPPPSGCPFADDVGKLGVRCRGTTTYVECRPPDAWGSGRRPEGYERDAVATGTPELGAYFAACAHLEAASVVAFEALGAEFASHGFPDDVIAACARAAREEEEHTRAIDRLAHRFGGETLPLFSIASKAPRPLLDIALENAVEGCVGELFGAAEALFRARSAADEEVRVALERIAEEEAGHAELSMQIGVLLVSRLEEEERARVREATVAARGALRAQIEQREWDPAVVSVAGVPRRKEGLAIFDALEAAVWSQAPSS